VKEDSSEEVFEETNQHSYQVDATNFNRFQDSQVAKPSALPIKLPAGSTRSFR
jgi:hypothetical protein